MDELLFCAAADVGPWQKQLSRLNTGMILLLQVPRAGAAPSHRPMHIKWHRELPRFPCSCQTELVMR